MKPNLLPMNLQMFAEEDGGTNFTFDFKAFVESNEEAQNLYNHSHNQLQINSLKQNNLEKNQSNNQGV